MLLKKEQPCRSMANSRGDHGRMNTKLYSTITIGEQQRRLRLGDYRNPMTTPGLGKHSRGDHRHDPLSVVGSFARATECRLNELADPGEQ